MASVTPLDKDLRKMRLDKYTPAAASEARSWIEGIVGEKLPSADLLEGLKDGVALCKLVNLTLQPPGVKFKQSAMPFVQMENISHFLRACQGSPLNLHQHDMFLTVDLYEQKDPAQVLQCLGAFSRAAHAVDSTTFPTTIGPRSRPGALSPQVTGSMSPTGIRNRGTSLTSNASSAYGGSRLILRQQTGDSVPGRWSPNRGHTKSPSNGGSPALVTSWSRKEQETATAPAWNIAQYGYMGGASQGNLGISFGGRRQITGAGPRVPSLAEKERRRKEAGERQRQEAEERRRAEVEAEEQRWAEETERLREAERRKAEEEKQQWEEQERQWQLTEQKRRQEDQAAQARLEEERRRVRSRSDNKLRGQYLSQYKAEQDRAESSPRSRVRELEKELELARQREAEYKRERQQLARPARNLSEKDARPETTRTRSGSWSKSDCEHLQTMQPARGQEIAVEEEPTADAALPFDPPSPVTPRRPLPNPAAAAAAVAVVPETSTSTSSRPLPDPARCGSLPAMATGRKKCLSANSQLAPQRTLLSRGAGAMAQSQSLTRAGGLASKSLLEREMELERQRQREWEEAQKETAKAVRPADGAVAGIGGGIGGRWDVGQWAGFTVGDSQNRGSQGIGAGRRPIVGPRPLPEPNR